MEWIALPLKKVVGVFVRFFVPFLLLLLALLLRTLWSQPLQQAGSLPNIGGLPPEHVGAHTGR
jgi:hypothetical protein